MTISFNVTLTDIADLEDFAEEQHGGRQPGESDEDLLRRVFTDECLSNTQFESTGFTVVAE